MRTDRGRRESVRRPGPCHESVSEQGRRASKRGLWSRRDPPHVVGDGVLTVKELVDKVNSDPRRGDGHATSLTKIRFDDIAVARLVQQGLTPESVPEKGQRVILRNNANLSTGGTATDVTDDVHPEVAARAIAAAQIVGLHVCGVDVVAEGVLRPLEEQNGGIVEVNAAPGLRMHLSPSYGKGRNVGEAVVNHLFSPVIGLLIGFFLNEEDVIIKIIRLGAKGYILKTMEPEELKTALDSVIKKSRARTPRLTTSCASVGILRDWIHSACPFQWSIGPAFAQWGLERYLNPEILR